MTCLRAAALIAGDDDFFRLALRGILIENLGIFEVVETETLDEAAEAIASHGAVKFAFFDVTTPGLDSFSVIRATRETFPDVRVTAISASCDRYDVLRALEAGAHGFVPKGEGVKQLGLAIKLIGEGGIYIPSFLTDIRNAQNDSYVLYPDSSAEPAANLDNITPRKQEVLNHLVKGMSNKEIARAMALSESAVKFHIASLCSRLGVKNRTEIAVCVSRLRTMSNAQVASGEGNTRSSPLRASRQTRASPDAVIASFSMMAARAGTRASSRAT